MSDSIPKHFDVIIIGGGPSGVACALGLKTSGLSVAIIDKASFPRDKICGDAIPGRALKVLNELDPKYILEFEKLNTKERITSTLLCSTKRRANVQWVLKAYNCTRVVFDNFLLNLVRQETNTTIFENTKVTAIETSKDLVNIETSKVNYTCSLVVACDGAQSIVAKRNAGFTVDREHYCSAVRAYYENISGSKEGRNEIYFSKKNMPGYFWLFPVGNNKFNLGFGMLSKTVAERKINLTKTFFDIIDEFPELKERMKNAQPVTKPIGFGLPLGTRKLSISGERFLLCGDAASLIDPASGDGIGNGMMSGLLAAQHICKNKASAIFSGEINKKYDESVYNRLGKELRKNTLALRISMKFPYLLNLGIFLLSDKNPLKKWIKKLI